MKLKPVAVALALMAAGPAVMAAACTGTFSLGTLGVNGYANFGQTLSGPGSFNHCYDFSVSTGPVNASGATLLSNWSWDLGLDFTSMNIAGTNVLSSYVTQFGQLWTFSDLTVGNYRLEVAGNVYDYPWSNYDGTVGYRGTLVITPVPEPESLAMLAFGLAAVAWGARRKKA